MSQEQRIIELLKKDGFQNIQCLDWPSWRYLHFRAGRYGQQCHIRALKGEHKSGEWNDGLVFEAAFASFCRASRAPALLPSFHAKEMDDGRELLSLAPVIDVELFGDHGSHKVTRDLTTRDFEDLFRMQLWLSRKGLKELPEAFQKEFSSGRHAPEKVQKRFMDNLLKASKFLHEEQVVWLKDKMNPEGLRWSLSHHDLVPHYAGRDRKSGKLVLFGAEFTRWGLWGYDMVYWPIQTICYYGDWETSRRFLATMRTKFRGKGIDLDELLLPAFAYRIAANLSEHPEGSEELARALEILRRLVDRGVRGIFSGKTPK